eukprot:gb/GECG01003683.1/.p1 GENE.gb/GECG01003683.1/~~gb/GECG01003683.1/.p1  ORF type:complete len:545 (+),score=63.63 gb/GECG01003683.1/:1-1635(+)
MSSGVVAGAGDDEPDIVVVIKRRLNSGGQASIYLAQTGYDEEADELIGVKIFRSTKPADKLQELLAYRRLCWKCPFILKAWAPLSLPEECDIANIDPKDPVLGEDTSYPRIRNHICLPVELCQSDVLSQIKKAEGGLGEDVGRRCVVEVMQAVAFAQNCGVAHCDLKPENVLVGMDGHVRLADWGSSIVTEPKSRVAPSRTVAGTAMYAAPEVIVQHNPDVDLRPSFTWDAFTADAWSIGVFTYVCVAGRPPFHKASIEDPYFIAFLRATKQEDEMLRLVNKIIHSNNKKTPEGEKLIDKGRLKEKYREASRQRYKFTWPEDMSHSLRELIRSLLCVDPVKRITVGEAVMHPWTEGEERETQEPASRSLSPAEDAESCHSSAGNLMAQGSSNNMNEAGNVEEEKGNSTDLEVCALCDLATVESEYSSCASELSPQEQLSNHSNGDDGIADPSTKSPGNVQSPQEVGHFRRSSPRRSRRHGTSSGCEEEKFGVSSPQRNINLNYSSPQQDTAGADKAAHQGKLSYLKSLWSRVRGKKDKQEITAQ